MKESSDPDAGTENFTVYRQIKRNSN